MMKRLVAFFISIILLFNLAACTCRMNSQQIDPTPTLSMSVASSDSPTAEPTAVPSEEDLRFEELDKEMFVSSVISNGLTYHQYVKNPESFGIDESDVERGWGGFTYDLYLQSKTEEVEFKKELEAINKEKLSERNRTAYDNMMHILECSIQMGDIYYCEEPLLPLNGDHMMLPLMLTLYEINNKTDVDNYFILLENTDEYISMLEQFEREKADKGMFMTENALDQVLETCKGYVESGESFFLIDSFEATIKAEGLGISDNERQSYIDRNRTYIINELLPAYQRLIDTLESLRDKCSEFTGAVNRSEAELDCYKFGVQKSGACFFDIADIEAHLKELCETTYAEMVYIMQTNASVYNHYFDDVTSGNAETDVNYLKSLIKDIYPELPEQSIDFITVPEAVADDFSPAAYLISAFDDPSRNVVMFNPSADDSTLLFMLAHECFPGHLYQTQYFRHLEGLPLSQQLMAQEGYLEGWAVFSEVFIADYLDGKYDSKTCRVKQLESTLLNILIPAYVSMKINIDGWTDTQVGEYLETYGVNQEGFRSIIYEYAIDMPIYFFNYALGYMNTKLIYDSVSPVNDAEKLEFFVQYLGYGPCSFNILFDKFNIEF